MVKVTKLTSFLKGKPKIILECPPGMKMSHIGVKCVPDNVTPEEEMKYN